MGAACFYHCKEGARSIKLCLTRCKTIELKEVCKVYCHLFSSPFEDNFPFLEIVNNRKLLTIFSADIIVVA